MKSIAEHTKKATSFFNFFFEGKAQGYRYIANKAGLCPEYSQESGAYTEYLLSSGVRTPELKIYPI